MYDAESENEIGPRKMYMFWQAVKRASLFLAPVITIFPDTKMRRTTSRKIRARRWKTYKGAVTNKAMVAMKGATAEMALSP
jgi:hypothetical protein